MKTPIILGIESSCDDTSAAIIQGKKILSNVVSTQKIHQNYGGVVPELASRAHLQNIVPVIHQAIQKANINKKAIDAISFTRGPGLLGSLLVKLIGLEYPAGPMIDKLSKEGNPNKFRFPLPKLDGIKFSFSGIKTSVLYFLQKELAKNPDFIKLNQNDICASVQKTIIAALIDKLKLAIQKTGIKNVAIAGGVSANLELRKEIKKLESELACKTFIPKFEYTTDNAAMIAVIDTKLM